MTDFNVCKLNHCTQFFTYILMFTILRIVFKELPCNPRRTPCNILLFVAVEELRLCGRQRKVERAEACCKSFSCEFDRRAAHCREGNRGLAAIHLFAADASDHNCTLPSSARHNDVFLITTARKFILENKTLICQAGSTGIDQHVHVL